MPRDQKELDKSWDILWIISKTTIGILPTPRDRPLVHMTQPLFPSRSGVYFLPFNLEDLMIYFNQQNKALVTLCDFWVLISRALAAASLTLLEPWDELWKKAGQAFPRMRANMMRCWREATPPGTWIEACEWGRIAPTKAIKTKPQKDKAKSVPIVTDLWTKKKRTAIKGIMFGEVCFTGIDKWSRVTTLQHACIQFMSSELIHLLDQLLN